MKHDVWATERADDIRPYFFRGFAACWFRKRLPRWKKGYRSLLFHEEMIMKARNKTALCRGGYHPPEHSINQND